ncbi:ROK family protein [Sodalis sp. RH16]|uniref:ROK family transcriptional regulator n=1 Tax=unclassified Sodalis (in: enterobacteria) TaxID=2636512 RepID=UPI0039B4E81B
MKKAGNTEGATLVNSAEILLLIAHGKASSRAALLEASGLSRVTVTHRLNALLAAGLVEESQKTLPSGGRPTRVLTVNDAAGIILVANIGEAFIHLAVMDLRPEILAQTTLPFTAKSSPGGALDQIHDAFRQLLEANRLAHRLLFGVSLSMPTPVDFNRGCVVGPSVLPGWDEFDIKSYLGKFYDAPIYVENDVNLMTIYEHRHNFPHVKDMFYIKMGTGIGSGIITDGRIFRGAQGAAGDVGHIQFTMETPPLCRCGKFGCVEARAGGWAIARDLSAMGYTAGNALDVVELVENNRPEAIMLVRRAGQIIGEVIADVVSILNPALIVVGGTLATAGEFLLSGVRELVYQRCLPLATRELQILPAKPNGDSALYGAAHLVLDDTFRQDLIEGLLIRYGHNQSVSGPV